MHSCRPRIAQSRTALGAAAFAAAEAAGVAPTDPQLLAEARDWLRKGAS